MKNLTSLRIALAILFTTFSFSIIAQSLDTQVKQQEEKYLTEKAKLEDLRFDWIKEQLKKTGLPKLKDSKLKSNSELVYHNAFVLDYNESHEQANWVMHMILPQVFEFCTERTEDFRIDESVKTGSADQFFYSGLKKNKTDRGHLAPAADLRWSERAVSSSFYYSNMSPQSSKLNQGRWADLEKLMRAYVQFYENDPIIFVSGPILKDLNTGKVPKLNNVADGVSVPKRYFKIALDLKRKRAIGFVMDQKTSKRKSMKNLVKSIDEIEALTGIDFFARQRPKTEDYLEKQKDFNTWDVFTSLKSTSPVPVNQLKKGVLNTKQLKDKAASLSTQKVKVIGKVLSGSLNQDGGYVNLTLDTTKDPIRIRINKEALSKFNYKPERELRGALVTATGKVDIKKSFGNTYIYVIIENPSDLNVKY